MKKSLATFAILFSILSIGLISCDKEEENDDLPAVETSSYTFTIQGVTSTKVNGEISVCNDGFFTINGEDPSGQVLSVQTGKILIGETRDICDQNQWADCNDIGGLGLTIAANQTIFTTVSGSGTRTSDRVISVSGTAIDINDGQQYAFTLEATAGLKTPFNCE